MKKPLMLTLAALAVCSFGLHAAPPYSLKIGDVVVRGNPPRPFGITGIVDSSGVAQTSEFQYIKGVYYGDPQSASLGLGERTAHLSMNVPVEAKNYTVSLSDGSQIGLADAFAQAAESKDVRGEEYILTPKKSADRSRPDQLVVQRLERVLQMPDKKTYYLVDPTQQTWLSSDEIKAQSIYVTDGSEIGQVLRNPKIVSPGAHVVIPDYLIRDYSAWGMKRIFDAVSETQGGTEELLRLREILKPDTLSTEYWTKKPAADVTQWIDDSIARAAKVAAPDATGDAAVEKVIRDVKPIR